MRGTLLPELYVFVAIPGVPAQHNLAVRSIRPLGFARKISGELVVPKDQRPVWDSPVWMAQQLNPFHKCLVSLTLKPSLDKV
jgi:transposase